MPNLPRQLQLVWQELLRRKVVRAGVIYVTATGGLLAVLDNFSRLFPAVIDPVFPYLLFAAVLAYPVVLASAWSFEWSWSGLQPRPARDGHPVSMTTRLGALSALSAVSVAFGVAALQIWTPPDESEGATASPAPLTSIAVLPLDDYSMDRSLGQLARALSEFLTTELARVDGLEVKSRVETGLLREQGTSLKGRPDLGSWVEGSVAGTLDDFIVTLQLIDGASGDHVWAGEFSGSATRLESVLESVRDSLVVAMAHTVRQVVGLELQERAARAGAGSEAAWNHFLLGQTAAQAGRTIAPLELDQGLAQLARADSLLDRAAELDPDWIAPVVERGWVQISRGHLVGPRAGTVPHEFAAHAERYGQDALRRSPEHPEALELRGVARFWLAEAASDGAEDLYQAAEADLVAATLQDPDRARAWEIRTRIEWRRGDFASARTSAEQALRLDHFLMDRSTILHDLVQISLDQRDVEGAARWCSQGRRENPESPDFLICNLFILTNVAEPPVPVAQARLAYDSLRQGTGEAAWPSYQPWADLWLSILFARQNQRDSALARLRDARGEDGEIVDPYEEARIMVVLQDEARALELLAMHLEAEPGRKAYLRNDWWFEDLWDHPRFIEITGG